MKIKTLLPVALLALSVPLGACTIDVDETADGRDTGIAVYPGATLAQNDKGNESANVNIGASWFGVKVSAAKYESDASPDQIAEFYRNELKTYGPVTECHGDIDFKGPKGAKKPVCKGNSSGEVQLVVGTVDSQHIAAIKRRGSGSEFALVYLETRGAD